MSADFSVIIPTLGRPGPLQRTLESLVACDPPATEIIVVDGDPHRSAEKIVAPLAERSEPPRVRYLHGAEGLTAQRNAGIKAASSDVVVFFDDDVVVGGRVFGELRECYGDPDVVGATGVVVEASARRLGGKRSRLRRLLPGGGREGFFTRYGYPRRIQDESTARDVEFMQGCFMSGRKQAVSRVGFDEKLNGYALAEDEDFSYRLSRLGRLRHLPGAVVHHENTGFRSHDSRTFGRMVVVNRAYLFRKNFPQTRLARAQFIMLIGILVCHRAFNRDWPGVRGVLEGAVSIWRPSR